jgi:hypothetical protein
MRSRWRILVPLVACVMCACMGIALAAPPTLPCNSDSTRTCAFGCTPFTGYPGYMSISCADMTQVPYCANTTMDTCSPMGQYINCAGTKYTDGNCTQGQMMQSIPTPGCKP